MTKKTSENKKEFPNYARLYELAGKARTEVEKILKIVGKEADLSSKLLKGKIDIMNMDSRIEKKYLELGKETYSLVENKEISNNALKTIVDEISGLYGDLEQKRNGIEKLKQQMKKAVSG